MYGLTLNKHIADWLYFYSSLMVLAFIILLKIVCNLKIFLLFATACKPNPTFSEYAAGKKWGLFGLTGLLSFSRNSKDLNNMMKIET